MMGNDDYNLALTSALIAIQFSTIELLRSTPDSEYWVHLKIPNANSVPNFSTCIWLNWTFFVWKYRLSQILFSCHRQSSCVKNGVRVFDRQWCRQQQHHKHVLIFKIHCYYSQLPLLLLLSLFLLSLLLSSLLLLPLLLFLASVVIILVVVVVALLLVVAVIIFFWVMS